MKKSRSELKLMAKKALTGNYGTAVGAVLIFESLFIGIFLIFYFVLIAGVMAAAIGGESFLVGAGIGMIVAVCLFLLAMMLCQYLAIPGFVKIYFNICNKGRAQIGDLFFAFRNGLGKFIGLAVLLGVSILAASIIQMIITEFGNGIGLFLYIIVYLSVCCYIGLNFGLVYYILVDKPELKLMEALKLSKAYMVGNKKRLFVLGLSFVGWFFLAYATCYIGLLWLMPYMGCTTLFFYQDVKAEHEPKTFTMDAGDYQAEFYQNSSEENPDA